MLRGPPGRSPPPVCERWSGGFICLFFAVRGLWGGGVHGGWRGGGSVCHIRASLLASKPPSGPGRSRSIHQPVRLVAKTYESRQGVRHCSRGS
uniref:Putative secreted protein n=1 Tax=Anopheles darlingi TaxID=43151 RepID=A0A2M4D7V5_ANODA